MIESHHKSTPAAIDQASIVRACDNPLGNSKLDNAVQRKLSSDAAAKGTHTELSAPIGGGAGTLTVKAEDGSPDQNLRLEDQLLVGVTLHPLQQLTSLSLQNTYV